MSQRLFGGFRCYPDLSSAIQTCHRGIRERRNIPGWPGPTRHTRIQLAGRLVITGQGCALDGMTPAPGKGSAVRIGTRLALNYGIT